MPSFSAILIIAVLKDSYNPYLIDTDEFKDLVKKEFSNTITKIVFHILPISEEQYRSTDMIIEKLSKAFNELSSKYGVVVVGLDLITGFPQIVVNTRLMELKNVSEYMVLDAIRNVIGNDEYLVEVIFTPYHFKLLSGETLNYNIGSSRTWYTSVEIPQNPYLVISSLAIVGLALITARRVGT